MPKLKLAKRAQQDHKISIILPGAFDNLQISRDRDTPKHPWCTVLLYTPSIKDTNNHYHIVLNQRQARKLRNWLTGFLHKL